MQQICIKFSTNWSNTIGILMASFYKHCCRQWPSDSRSMWVGCSRRSEAPLVLVSPYLEMLDSDLKVSRLLLTQQASTQRFNWCTLDQWPLVKSATRSIGLQWLILALLILQRDSYLFSGDLSLWHLPQRWYYREVYSLAFLCRRGAVFHCQGGSYPWLMMGLDGVDLDRKDKLIITI